MAWQWLSLTMSYWGVEIFSGFVIALLSSSVVLGVIIKMSWTQTLYQEKNRSRDIHTGLKPRIGGLVIIPLFVIGMSILAWKQGIMWDSLYTGFIASALMILVYGYWDEKYDLPWQIQLLIQSIIALIVIISGIGIEAIMIPFGDLVHLDVWTLSIGTIEISLPGDFVTFFWIVGLMNVINWLDGMDGLAAGVGIIGYVILAILALTPFVLQPHIALIAMLCAGLYGGFLWHNWYPSSLFLGTYGSMFLGYSLAVLSIISGGKMATAGLVLAFPIVDAFSVVSQRLIAGQSIFEADKRHFHHKLLQLGLSQRNSVLLMYAISFIFGVSALYFETTGKALIFGIGAVGLVSISWIIDGAQGSRK